MKFRVLSDLHVDINERHPVEIPEAGRDVFTVLCGDTSGGPELTIEWTKKNVRRGVLVSGNHLPYCNIWPGRVRSMYELRRELAAAFPSDGDVSYLDVETGFFKKAVDGILFIGSCCYTDMRISHETLNPGGDPELNRRCSEWNMNDYKYGYVSAGAEDGIGAVRMKASDYMKWAENAKAAFSAALDENESSASPLPVVLVTHHPVVPHFLTKSYYVEDCSCARSKLEFNWASYASDWTDWLKSHPSIKCCCCGHIHDVMKDFRHFDLDCGGRKILVVNNARGYVDRGHDLCFNVNTFVDTESWTVEELPIPAEETARREAAVKRMMAFGAWL